MNFPPGVRSKTVKTNRLNVRYIDSGPEDGVPVVMIHGNLSTGRFFEHLMPGAPAAYRLIAPDMRGFGDTERKPIDATRGLHDWADDTFSLVQALGITRPVHLAGWSTGGAAIANYAVDRPVASLTFVDPVSPYGFGGVKLDGAPCFPRITPGRGRRHRETSTSQSASQITTRQLRVPVLAPQRHQLVVLDAHASGIARTRGHAGGRGLEVGDRRRRLPRRFDGVHPTGPRIAPGTRGILNALSPEILQLVRRRRDRSQADQSCGPMARPTSSSWPTRIGVGRWGPWSKPGLSFQAGWPGEEDFPPQPMVTQIRSVLEAVPEQGRPRAVRDVQKAQDMARCSTRRRAPGADLLRVPGVRGKERPRGCGRVRPS